MDRMMDRRTFLGGGLTLALASQIPEIAFALAPRSENQWLLIARSANVLGGASFTSEGPKDPEPSVLRIYKTSVQRFEKVPLDFSPHSFVQSVKEPHLVYAVSKWRREACLIDVKKKVVVGSPQNSSEKRFFGHGLPLPDGRFLLSRYDDKAKKGQLVYCAGTQLGETVIWVMFTRTKFTLAPRTPVKFLWRRPGWGEKGRCCGWISKKRKWSKRSVRVWRFRRIFDS